MHSERMDDGLSIDRRSSCTWHARGNMLPKYVRCYHMDTTTKSKADSVNVCLNH